MRGEKRPLKIGLLIDSWELPAWAFRMLEIINDSDYASIPLVVLNGAASPAKGLLGRIGENRDIMFYRLYTRLENLVCRPRPDAFERKDASTLLESAEVLTVSPAQSGYWDIFSDEDSERISGYDLDVLIRLGFRLVKGKVFSSARHGIWSFHHGDNRVLRGGPSGFWEVFKHHPMTGSVLQVLDEKVDNGIILSRSWSSTNQFAVKNSRNKYYWKTLSLLPRALKELHDDGEEAFSRRRERDNPPLGFYDRPMYRPPGNLEFLGALFGHTVRSAGRVLQRMYYHEDWGLMYRLGDGISTSFRQFRKIVPPKDRFWADPHVLFRDGRYYIFMEEWIYPATKGHISLLIMNDDGTWEGPTRLLEPSWHLAYPMVFEWEGETYMIPDSAANSTVDVYRCNTFPLRWSHCATLMKNIRAVDPTLFQHGGRWWLFANVKEHPGASYSDELFLFSSDSPLGERWTPHPRNPVVSDARKARPAGRIIEREGKLFRVSQNCSRGYGYGMNIHEIVTLDEREYEERDIQSLEPKWDPAITAMHTLSHAGNITVIDAKFRRRRFP